MQEKRQASLSSMLQDSKSMRRESEKGRENERTRERYREREYIEGVYNRVSVLYDRTINTEQRVFR